LPAVVISSFDASSIAWRCLLPAAVLAQCNAARQAQVRGQYPGVVAACDVFLQKH